jgi:hypothetical protein
MPFCIDDTFIMPFVKCGLYRVRHSKYGVLIFRVNSCPVDENFKLRIRELGFAGRFFLSLTPFRTPLSPGIGEVVRDSPIPQ